MATGPVARSNEDRLNMIVAPKLVSDPLDATRIVLPPGSGVGAFFTWGRDAE